MVSKECIKVKVKKVREAEKIGLSATFVRDIPANAVYFGFYGKTNEFI